MANSLLIGVTGLRVHQQMLETVGNNLANTNTTGFKSQRVRFADLLYQTLSPGSLSTATTGGVNPIQAGLGVRLAAIDSNVKQGALEATGAEFDFALRGNGYFVLGDGTATTHFTRAGAFAVDQNNFLVDPATGLRVQRFGSVGEGTATTPAFQTSGDNNIKIPFATVIPGQATTTTTLQGNLSANATGFLAQVLTSAQPFRVGAAAATAASTLNSLSTNTVDYAAGDQIRLQGSTHTGAVVDVLVPVSAAFTLGDLVNAVNANFPGSTATLDASGNLVVTAGATGPSQLSLTISDATPAPPQVGATTWFTHGETVTTQGKDGDKLATAIQVFDTQGTGHTLSLEFQKQTSNTWDLTASIPTAEGTMTDNLVQGITFNDDGSFRQVSGAGAGDGRLTMQINGLANPQTITLDFGTPNGFNGLVQVGGNSSAAATGQDGFAAGLLTTVSASEDGILNGLFTNGKLLPLAQFAIATFANPAGLDREGDNLLRVGSQSGIALIGTAQSGGRGAVQHGALENSNVDVAQEFTRLIIAQRGFQVNARTITVADQMLQELASIIR